MFNLMLTALVAFVCLPSPSFAARPGTTVGFCRALLGTGISGDGDSVLLKREFHGEDDIRAEIQRLRSESGAIDDVLYPILDQRASWRRNRLPEYVAASAVLAAFMTPTILLNQYPYPIGPTALTFVTQFALWSAAFIGGDRAWHALKVRRSPATVLSKHLAEIEAVFDQHASTILDVSFTTTLPTYVHDALAEGGLTSERARHEAALASRWLTDNGPVLSIDRLYEGQDGPAREKIDEDRSNHFAIATPDRLIKDIRVDSLFNPAFISGPTWQIMYRASTRGTSD